MGTTVAARDWIFEVSSDGGTTWTTVDGVTKFELDYSQDGNQADTTDFDSAGIASAIPMQRGAKLTLSGNQKTGATAGDWSDGYTALSAASVAVGDAGLVAVHFRHTSETSWHVWDECWVESSGGGGGVNDRAAYQFAITRSGPETSATVSVGDVAEPSFEPAAKRRKAVEA
jgi:hypothetical protein